MPRSWCAESSGHNTAHPYDKDPTTPLNDAYHGGVVLFEILSKATLVIDFTRVAFFVMFITETEKAKRNIYNFFRIFVK